MVERTKFVYLFTITFKFLSRLLIILDETNGRGSSKISSCYFKPPKKNYENPLSNSPTKTTAILSKPWSNLLSICGQNTSYDMYWSRYSVNSLSKSTTSIERRMSSNFYQRISKARQTENAIKAPCLSSGKTEKQKDLPSKRCMHVYVQQGSL